MFNDVERPCELIFYILWIQKSDVDKVAELMFQAANGPDIS
jgi:hypothetical protein